MRWVSAVLMAAVVAGCPVPPRYVVEQPGLPCDRATRVAYRTMLALGFTVTEIDPAAPEHPGVVAGTKSGADGTPHAGRVRIRCEPAGAVLEPVEDALVPASFEFSRAFGLSFRTLVQGPDVDVPRAARGLEVLVHLVPPGEARLDLGGLAVAGDAVLARVTVRNHTERAVVVDGGEIELARTRGGTVRPLAGDGIAPGLPGDRVRAGLLGRTRVAPGTVREGYLTFPPGEYREALVPVLDAETDVADGMLVPVQ